jgi:hypothetical protein
MAVTVCCLFLSAPEKLLVTTVQTMLSLPGDSPHLGRDAFVALTDCGAHGRSTPVAPPEASERSWTGRSPGTSTNCAMVRGA